MAGLLKTSDRVDLKGFFPEELEAFVASLGLEPYRARQIAAWIYNRGTTDFAEMTNLTKAVRATLRKRASILSLKVAARAGQRAPRTRRARRATHRGAQGAIARPKGSRSLLQVNVPDHLLPAVLKSTRRSPRLR